MRKSQIKVQLDQEQCHKAKELAIEVSLLKLIKQNEIENSIQELYGATEPKKLDSKSLYQAVCITRYC